MLAFVELDHPLGEIVRSLEELARFRWWRSHPVTSC